MPNHNQITILGRLTGQPEMKYTPAGDALCKFDVAVETGWGERKKTSFFRVVAWRKQAEYCDKYLSKGKHVLVVGAHVQDKYKDKDGNSRDSWELNADSVQGVDRPDQDRSEQRTSAPAKTTKNEEVQNLDW